MELMRLEGEDVQVYSCVTAVVGSGAAGFKAASELHDAGAPDVILVSAPEHLIEEVT